ncbi:MAG: DUF4249 family protein [Bacteroidales bacterium]|nr:DUF4249 family protein [Bacteroidales bacterium]
MNIIRILFAVVALIVSTACERDSVIDVGQEKTTPIMTAYFYRDSSLLVNVYSSVSFYSSAYYQPLTDAYISIIRNGIYEQKVAVDSGAMSVTFDNISVKADDSIRVEVTSVEGQMSASTQVLQPVNFTVTASLRDSIVDCNASVVDGNVATDYFQFQVFADDSLVDCYYYDDIFEATFATSDQLLGLFTDSDFNGRLRYVRFAFNINDTKRSDGKNATIRVRLYHHTYDYYQYLSSIQGAFVNTVLPILGQSYCYTNVNGGYGIVSGMSYTEQEIDPLE